MCHLKEAKGRYEDEKLREEKWLNISVEFSNRFLSKKR